MLSPAQNLSRGQRRRWPEAYATTAITLAAAGSGGVKAPLDRDTKRDARSLRLNLAKLLLPAD
jgi:hypothetical protein